MFDLGMQELIVIFIVALLVFGPKRLPELGKTLGKGLGELKRAFEDVREQVHAEMEEVRKIDVPGEDVPKEDAATRQYLPEDDNVIEEAGEEDNKAEAEENETQYLPEDDNIEEAGEEDNKGETEKNKTQAPQEGEKKEDTAV